jgi:ring-1,2-phenylacetyl-CoA epoxidase subunit PaaE
VTPAVDVDHVWLCGPLAMVTDARDVVAGFGVPRDKVHVELFYVDEPPPPVQRADPITAPGETSEVTIVLDGRSATSAFPRDRPILDSAQATRADLPFACKGGVCGTCRARVTAGEVAMRRNFALEPEEIAAGFVLTCQSLPVTATVTVDFDA